MDSLFLACVMVRFYYILDKLHHLVHCLEMSDIEVIQCGVML